MIGTDRYSSHRYIIATSSVFTPIVGLFSPTVLLHCRLQTSRFRTYFETGFHGLYFYTQYVPVVVSSLISFISSLVFLFVLFSSFVISFHFLVSFFPLSSSYITKRSRLEYQLALLPPVPFHPLHWLALQRMYGRYVPLYHTDYNVHL